MIVVRRDFYEALLPLARAELERMSEAGEPQLARLVIDSVELADGDEIVVLFRDPERPACRFGWRWSWAEDPREGELDYAAGMLRVNLEEDVLSDRYGLPDDCEPGVTTWF